MVKEIMKNKKSEKISKINYQEVIADGKSIVKPDSKGNKDKKKKSGLSFVHSIRFNLTVGFLVPVIFIFIIGIVSYTQASKAIKKNYRDAIISTINTTGEYYGLILQNMEDKSLQIASDFVTKKYYSGSYKKNQLEETKWLNLIKSNISSMVASDSFINSISIFTHYGQPLSSAGSFMNDPKETIYNKYKMSDEGETVLKGNNNVYWSGYHRFIDEELKLDQNQYGISLTREYLDVGSKSIGYVIVDVKLSVIRNVMTDLVLPEGSKFVFVTPDGREISDTNETEPIILNQDFYINSKDQEVTSGFQNVKYNNQDYLYIYQKVSDTGVMVCSVIPASFLTSQTDSIRNLTFVLVLIGSAIAVTIGLNLSTGIGTTIHKVVKHLEKVSSGDLTVQFTTKRKDEFNVLSKSINSMINNVRILVDKAAVVGDEVALSATNVNNNTSELLEATKHISRALQEIESGIVHQAEDATTCVSESNLLSDKITIVHDTKQEIDEITRMTNDIVKHGIDTIYELKDKAKSTSGMTKMTIEDIEDLAKRSDSINNIVGVINEIAAQTNLLSLNASIEAARAGEAGRGFAVVSDEIKKLADKSMESAKDIGDIISSIIYKTNDSVNTVKKADAYMVQLEDTLLNVVKVFENIRIQVDGLSNKLEVISEQMDDMEKSKMNTLNSIVSISAVSEESAAAIEEMDATVTTQLTSVEHLSNASNLLIEDAKQLDLAIRAFQI
jgi:methyl-accepting chemotaxis protein